MIRRRCGLRGVVLALLCWASSGAQALVWAIHDGAHERVDDAAVRARYAAIATDLAKLLRESVTIVPVGSDAALRQGLRTQAYDLVWLPSTPVSIAALRQGYQLLAVAQGPDPGYAASRVRFLVRADSPLRSLSELPGLRLGVPGADSIATWIARATLRDAIGDAANRVSLVPAQAPDAVPFFVAQGLTHAGATDVDSLVQAWQAGGGRVLAASRPVPAMQFIAAPSLSAAQVAGVRDYLLGLSASPAGRAKLAPTGWRGFVAYEHATLLAVGRWLGL